MLWTPKIDPGLPIFDHDLIVEHRYLYILTESLPLSCR